MTHERIDGNITDKDFARTPPSLYAKLDARFHFKLDAACTRANCLCKLGVFNDEGWDFLNLPLRYLVRNMDAVWCNPPYSRGMIEPFCKKSYEESLNGVTVVMLLPSDTSTKYFHNYCMKASEIIFITPRVHFNNPDGSMMNGSPKFGSMVVVFRQEDFDGSPIISSMNWK